MHRFLALAAAAVAISLAGCASTSSTTSTASADQKPMEEKEYRVGSRIPVKDPAVLSPNGTN